MKGKPWVNAAATKVISHKKGTVAGSWVDGGQRWEENLPLNTLFYVYINGLPIHKVDSATQERDLRRQ